MPTFHPALMRWLRAHHGVVNRATLLDLGLTKAQIEALRAVGELIVVHKGVYRHSLWPETFLSRCVAICAADPRLVICCGGAAQLWAFRRARSVGLHASSTSAGLGLSDGTVIHRCLLMPTNHVHRRPDGIRVTSPARTVFDNSKHLQPADIESMIEQGLDRSQFDIPTLYALGRLLCGRGRDGSHVFIQVLMSRPSWRRPVGSHPELALLRAMTARGVHLETQVSLTLLDGQVIHPDLGDPTIGFYIEIDDHEWHGGRIASSYDKRRDRLVRLGGGRVERVDTDEIDSLKPALLDHLVAAHRQQHSLSLRTG